MEARERILVKTHELFNKFGIKRVTMDEIALKTGMSKKTIYQSFSNKDELVDAVLVDHLSKSFCNCEANRSKADNAVHEIFLNIDMVQELMTEMNPTIFYDLEKFHPTAFQKLYEHKNKYMFKTIKENLEWGVKDGLFRSELNLEVMTKLRVETMFLPFNQDVFPYSKYNLAEVEKQALEHYLYGIATVKAHKLIDKYKLQRLKTN
jgi:AcrR family transcriptional regulator